MSFGLAPVGFFPAGAGEFATATAPPTTVPTQAKFINYNSRDYERNFDGSYKRMPITRQRVLVALSSFKQSSTIDPSFGISFPEKMDESFGRKIRLEVREAVSHIVADGSLTILNIDIDIPKPGAVDILFSYHDNLLDQPDTVKI